MGEARPSGLRYWGCACPLLALYGAVTLAVAVGEVDHSHRGGPMSAAQSALKGIATAQAVFREQDRELDGNSDYGTLTELGAAGLVDAELATGTKHGYLFRAAPAPASPGERWIATADPFRAPRYDAWGQHVPVLCNCTGDLFFAINQACEVRYSRDGPFELTADASIPARRDVRPGALVLSGYFLLGGLVVLVVVNALAKRFARPRRGPDEGRGEALAGRPE